MAGVHPTILAWARETAGLSLAEAARKIGLNDARGAEGADRRAAYEAGEGLPSATVLRRMAQQYRRPMLTFYLATPPESDDVGEDFRTLPERSDPQNVLLATLLRDVLGKEWPAAI